MLPDDEVAVERDAACLSCPAVDIVVPGDAIVHNVFERTLDAGETDVHRIAVRIYQPVDAVAYAQRVLAAGEGAVDAQHLRFVVLDILLLDALRMPEIEEIESFRKVVHPNLGLSLKVS